MCNAEHFGLCLAGGAFARHEFAGFITQLVGIGHHVAPATEGQRAPLRALEILHLPEEHHMVAPGVGRHPAALEEC